MKIVVNNITKEDDLRERVLQTMIKQIKKKFLVAEGSKSIREKLPRSVQIK